MNEEVTVHLDQTLVTIF